MCADMLSNKICKINYFTYPVFVLYLSKNKKNFNTYFSTILISYWVDYNDDDDDDDHNH